MKAPVDTFIQIGQPAVVQILIQRADVSSFARPVEPRQKIADNEEINLGECQQIVSVFSPIKRLLVFELNLVMVGGEDKQAVDDWLVQ